MPAFQTIINYPPNPDSLKSGADKINYNFGIIGDKAYIESSAGIFGVPIVTSLPSGQILRINSVYSVKKSNDFSGSTNGNLQYTGTPDINGIIHFDVFIARSGGAGLAVFYPASGDVANIITGVVYVSPGVVDVVTSQDHGYTALDIVIIEGTTDYNGSYSVISIPSSTSFRISAVFTSSQTGQHAKALVESPFLTRLQTDEGLVSFARVVSGIQTGDILFLAGEAVGGGNLQLYANASVFFAI